MGRAIATAGPSSGRSGGKLRKLAEKGKVKQRKRKKDLEVLHRNVLEAKKNLRRQAANRGIKKWKTAFSKVLTNFADVRQQNDETTHAVEKKKGRKTKTKTICNRLLPEMTVGVFKNGAKGRAIHKISEYLDGTSNARLEGDVLKLLNGDETNPNLPAGNAGANRAEKRKQFRTKETAESDEGASESSRHVVNSPALLGKRKSDKRRQLDRESEKKGAAKAREQPPLPQRQNACKRRLFEPDDENETDENSFGIIDRTEISGEICFPATRKSAQDSSTSENRLKKRCAPEEKEEEADGARRKLDWRRIKSKFWGWSPEVCYERLCAKVCAENFQRNHRHALDSIATVHKALAVFYTQSRYSRDCTATNMEDSRERGDAIRGKNSPLDKSSDGCSSFSSLPTFAETDVDSSSDESRQGNKKCCVYEEDSSSCNKVKQTIDSVTLFLDQLANNNKNNSSSKSSKDRETFAAEIAAASRSKEKSDNYLEENARNVVKRNGKHVPTILRRSRSRSINSENLEDEVQAVQRCVEMSSCSSSNLTNGNLSFPRTPSLSQKIVYVEKDEAPKSNRTNRARRKSKNVERAASSDDLVDVQSFDETRCIGAFPVREVRHVERAEDPREKEKRRIPLIADEQQLPRFRRTKPSDPRLAEHPVTSNRAKFLPRSRQENLGPEIAHCHVQPLAGSHEMRQRLIATKAQNYSRFCGENDSQYNREAPSRLEQHFRMPVMLFKPIQTCDNNPSTFRSHYEKSADNSVATMSNAIRNLNVYNYPQITRKPSFVKEQHQVSPGQRILPQNLSYENQELSSQRFSQSLCNDGQRIARTLQNNEVRREIVETQPAKFLAFQPSDARDSQRIPIYTNTDRQSVISSGISGVDVKSERAELIYAKTREKVVDVDPQRQLQQQQHHDHHYYHAIDPSWVGRKTSNREPPSDSYTRMASRVIPRAIGADAAAARLGFGNEQQNPRGYAQLPLVVSSSSPKYFNGPPTSSNNPPRMKVHNEPDRESLLSDRQIIQQPRYSVDANYNGNFRLPEIVTKRVQLLDGTTGLFVPENRPISVDRQAFDPHVFQTSYSPCSQRQTCNNLPTATSTAPTLGLCNISSRNCCNIPECESYVSAQHKYQPECSRVNGNLCGNFRETRVFEKIFVPENCQDPLGPGNCSHRSQNPGFSCTRRIGASSVCQCNRIYSAAGAAL